MEGDRFHWSRTAFADAALASAVISILFAWGAYDEWPTHVWMSILVGGISVVSAAVTVGWLTATTGLALTIDNVGMTTYARGLFHRPRRRRDYPWSVIHRLRIQAGPMEPSLTRRVSMVELHLDLEPHALSTGKEHPAIQLSFFAEPINEVLASIRRAAGAAGVELEVDPAVVAPGALRRPVRIPRRPSG